MSYILSQNERQNFSKLLEQAPKNLSSIAVELLYTWEGENVSEIAIKLFQPTGSYTSNVSKYTYDNMLNPFHINWANFGTEFELLNCACINLNQSLSKNNFIQNHNEFSLFINSEAEEPLMSSSFVENISYEYDGKYPVKAVHSHEDGTVSETYFFEYLK